MQRSLQPFYSRCGGSSQSTLQHWVTKLETIVSINNQPIHSSSSNTGLLGNKATAYATVQQKPRQSTEPSVRTWPSSHFNLSNFKSGLRPIRVQNPTDAGAQSS
ncbi:hypothetical protein WA026_001666 [Henosepilachna vigintioctopunctata]|uniref:Uncharacterized protein n=1 Tax=Henosepilachna vigintioctopunctata TaxID=420089 RepID=A0AAW1USM1_9CUCU